ncbi:hypothetical protein GCM10025864_15790 [Luteimicrobium album]|uniref:Uncharacterized protein n=1 Tax=Luteimicrobium album TaxID=1054550 RepID=A0ABQ6I1Z3_9MICO|nr:hypothetical protein [Luteimicrobium album]GMA23820.1 hypothetical protein GCM10025864_15790 [Luteimicrobium album]
MVGAAGPPIYQPEVAARAVAWAVDHPQRREWWIGASTAGTIGLNAVVPGLLDRYLARTGFDSQQTADPRSPDQPANLWEAADGQDGRDFGAHGIFDDRAHGSSVQAWATRHRRVLELTAAGAVATLAGLASARAAGRS